MDEKYDDHPETRLALCAAGELFGGVERQLVGVSAWMQRRGRRPLVILFHDREVAEQARQLGVEVVILAAKCRFDPRLPWRLAVVLRSHGVNVVHCHGYKAMVLCALARALYPFGIIKTEHGLLEASRGQPLTWLKGRFYRLLDDVATRFAASMVCYVTDDVRSHCDKRHRRVSKCTVLNGIDPVDDGPLTRPPELERGYFHVGIVGRVTAVKGISYGVQAVAHPSIPDRIRLNVIGTGPSIGSLKQEATALGAGDRIRFLGFRRNVLNYVAHLDALLLPSMHEGLPYTLLEGMALAVPVIASRVGGLAEVLRDGSTAMLVDPGDVTAIRNAIVTLYADPDKAGAIGRAGRKDQRKRLTLERMGAAYWAHYREVAEIAYLAKTANSHHTEPRVDDVRREP